MPPATGSSLLWCVYVPPLLDQIHRTLVTERLSRLPFEDLRGLVELANVRMRQCPTRHALSVVVDLVVAFLQVASFHSEAPRRCAAAERILGDTFTPLAEKFAAQHSGNI